MKRRISRLMLAFLALAVLLGACGQPDTLPNPTPTDSRFPAVSSEPQSATGTTLAAPAARPAPTVAPPDNRIAGVASTKTYMPLVVQRPAASTTWTQLGGNAQRTGYININLTTTWRYKWIWNGPVGGGNGGAAAGHLLLPQGVQPVVGNGKLFVGHSDGMVRAINESDGSVAWSRNVGGQILNTAAYDSATNTVYVTSTNGLLVQLNATNGSIIDSFDTGSSIVSAPLLYGETLYVSTLDGSVIAVDRNSMTARWSYLAGAEIRASPSYSANHGGLVIIAAEDKSIHAIRASDGMRAWREIVNADQDPMRGNKSFSDTFPVVSDANDVVIIRSYFDWQKTWTPPMSSVAEIRTFLTNNPEYQSFHVLRLDNGRPRYVAPVLGGAIGNNDDYYSTPPQAVVKTFPDGSEVAYLLWRNIQACTIEPNNCDSREDTTVGEMDLSTGNIRFVRDYKNDGSMRLPTDEQGALSMAGDLLFQSHWMLLGGLQITNRSPSLGSSRNNPIEAFEMPAIGNTLEAGTCPTRDSANHYCPERFYPPGGGWLIDPGFYIYESTQKMYDVYWAPPVRGAVFGSGSIYWRSNDGAIIGLRAD